MNEDIQLDKLRILVNAVKVLEEEDEPDFYGILKECAWNILHENPGTEFGDWVTMLMSNTPPRSWTLSAHTLPRRMRA